MMRHFSKQDRCRAAALALGCAVTLAVADVAHGSPPICAQFRYDAQHTGRTVYTLTRTPAFEWSYAVGTSCSATPVIGADGTVYFGAYDRCFYAIAPDGTPSWRFRTYGTVTGSAAVGADGSIYFATMGGQLYALDSTGAAKWTNPMNFGPPGAAGSLLLAGDGVICFGSDSNQVLAVNPDGTLRWTYTTGGQIKQAPALSCDGAVVYVAAGDGVVYAIGNDGTLRWKSAAILPSTGCAVGGDGTIYVGTSDGRLLALNPNGTVRWTFRAASKITAQPAIGADGSVYFGSQDSNLYALNPNGTLKWTYRTNTAIYSAPVLDASGALVFGSWTGSLIALSTENGGALWTRSVASNVYTSPVIGFGDGLGCVYVLDNSGVLTKFSGPAIAPAVPEPCSALVLCSLLASLGTRWAARRKA